MPASKIQKINKPQWPIINGESVGVIMVIIQGFGFEQLGLLAVGQYQTALKLTLNKHGILFEKTDDIQN